ncbi:helix-turn-helix transcriptional regulator [Mycobacterium alsense]|uniref:helix-turn-helix transcriptional regulator n=1 Tax=Mycobacterium alsense TaxID=324058 RepID=UPI000B011086|nr:helix-turn-helix domain-containing protein [Mycobacterium alsense]
MQDEWLTRREVAAREKMPPATLAQWASQGRGPKYALFGRHARYRLSDVIAWENAQFGDEPTPEPGAIDDELPSDCAKLTANLGTATRESTVDDPDRPTAVVPARD